MAVVAVKMPMDDGKRDQLSFQSHSWRGPAIIMPTPSAPSSRAGALFLDPGGGFDAERLKIGRRFLRGTRLRNIVEKDCGVEAEGLDLSILSEVEVEPAPCGVPRLSPQAHRRASVVEAEAEEHWPMVRDRAKERAAAYPGE